MAKLRGEWVDPPNDAFITGSMVHSWSQLETLGEFKREHPEMFKKDGTLYAKYEIANKMIDTLKNDPMVEKVRQGTKEVILTGEYTVLSGKL
jgi:hypothetical protein